MTISAIINDERRRQRVIKKKRLFDKIRNDPALVAMELYNDDFYGYYKDPCIDAEIDDFLSDGLILEVSDDYISTSHINLENDIDFSFHKENYTISEINSSIYFHVNGRNKPQKENFKNRKNLPQNKVVGKKSVTKKLKDYNLFEKQPSMIITNLSVPPEAIFKGGAPLEPGDF